MRSQDSPLDTITKEALVAIMCAIKSQGERVPMLVDVLTVSGEIGDQ